MISPHWNFPGKTEPNQQPVEGWSSSEETQRAKALWLELLEKPIPERKAWQPGGWLHSGRELDMTWISQWWIADGVITVVYKDCGEVLNGFLWPTSEIFRDYFEHPWRSFKKTSRVSTKLRLLTNLLWLDALAWYSLLLYSGVLRNDICGSSLFSELGCVIVDVNDSVVSLVLDECINLIQFTL